MPIDLVPLKKRAVTDLFAYYWRVLEVRIHRVPTWVWWGAIVVIALRIYFFQEFIAAYLIFAVLFGSLLVFLLAIYLVSELGDRGMEWMEVNGRRGVKLARQQWGHAAMLVQESLHRHHHGRPAHRIG